MSTKLSYSAISTYSTCGYKYYKHYIERKRDKFLHGALIFGSAMDAGLNKLLLTKDLEQGMDAFHSVMNEQLVNGVPTLLYNYKDIVYAESDFDPDLITQENLTLCNLGDKDVEVARFRAIREQKALVGFNKLTDSDKEFYNTMNWISLTRKGEIMMNSYNLKVMPRIREVKAVQYESKMENCAGDSVIQFVDLVVEWEDGSIVLFDNKTSAKNYDETAAVTSQQLISYYYQNKEQFGLTAVGYIVMLKNIVKNKIKTCSVCGKVSENNQVKTCAVEIEGKRCGGSLVEQIDPECAIQILISPVQESAVELVLDTFDKANEGIKSKSWYRNLLACNNGYKCPYFKSCWFGNDEDLIQLPPIENDT